jgi:uncharacterized membrane protein YeaQ/YmgE (transglycosylase-associated protein family)
MQVALCWPSRGVCRSSARPPAGDGGLCPFASVSAVTIVALLLIVIVVLLLAGSLVGLAFSLLWLALTGLVIGALGRLVLPGRREISLFATVLIGVAASLLGGILANLFDAGWVIQFIVAVALAAIGVALFGPTEHRRRPA